ncbi:MAG TPA: aldo/keto reductase [Candidatus Acidoferrales bacterium]|jgi:aryl-alcohol dehydrogenase-like predicted oxidoreductase|nr:aldo/keto reductase [Candidatus Acidoferrales bacterium]
MQKRRLGQSSLEVSPLCFGGNVFGWTADESTSFKLLDAFLAAGFNFIDTADSYSTWVAGHKGGESETIIGKWLKARGNRDKVIIATKVGSEVAGKKGLSKSYILSEVEESLRHLQTDYIDLYQSHRDDPGTPVEETLEAYAELVKQGKVRVIGASNFTAERLESSLQASRKNGYPRYESLQPNYNLYDRVDYETRLEALCVKEKLGVIPYFSLASGFLTGKYRTQADLEKSARGKFVQKYLNERGLKIVDALERVAKEHGSTPAQVALAWLISRPSITAPIASATSLEQLDQLLQATKLKLDPPAIEALNQASAYEQETQKIA